MENKFNLNTIFEELNNTIAKSVEKSTCEFFENEFIMSMASVSTLENLKDTPLLKNELFYTCRISIKNKQHITLRVTSDFIRIIFHDMFGSSAPIFNLEKLTDLERIILNGFFEHLVKNINPFLINENESAKIDPLNKTNLNLIFLIKNKNINAGKLSIEIPLNRLTVKPIQLQENFTYDDFIKNFAFVDLIAGYAKISLNDLKNLDKDDILVLEKSNIKEMTLKTPTIEHNFKVNPEPSIMLDLGDDKEEFDENIQNYEEETMSDKSMWDDIQIEVSAEFKKVKMTLGELKQISKGLVIDLGPVMNNEISLLVENKAVAKGEIVIINDKYGVKITEVFASNKKEQAPAPAAAQKQQAKPSKQQTQSAQPKPQAQQQKPAPQAKQPVQQQQAPQIKPQPPKQQAAKNDDFDYSNFEE